jgi:membrane protein implicated in regulation of membrane protease activity
MRLTSVSWWTQMFVSTFLTMIFIYIIKKAMSKVNVPIASDIVASV